MEPNIRDFDTEYLLGCVNVGRVLEILKMPAASAQLRLPPPTHHHHHTHTHTHTPQGGGSPIKDSLTIFLLQVPGKGVQLKQGEI